MDKSLSEANDKLEPKIIAALKATPQWWKNWVMIPLESVPLPVQHKPGTRAFLQNFRAAAVVREQAWIRLLKSGFPRGYNLEVHEGNPDTKARHEVRKVQRHQKETKTVSFAQVPRPAEERIAIEYQMTEKGLSISRAQGPHQRVRCFLADLAECDDESQQKAMLEKFPVYQRRKMINWLTKHTPVDDVTAKNVFSTHDCHHRPNTEK